MFVEWDDTAARRLQEQPRPSGPAAAQVRNTSQRHDNSECLLLTYLRYNIHSFVPRVNSFVAVVRSVHYCSRHQQVKCFFHVENDSSLKPLKEITRHSKDRYLIETSLMLYGMGE